MYRPYFAVDIIMECQGQINGCVEMKKMMFG